MKTLLRPIVAVVLAALPVLPCFAQPAPAAQPAPDAQPAPAQPAVGAPDKPENLGDLVITITGVEGKVQVRDNEGQPWRKAAVNMKLGPGAEFRTGPGGAVRCTIPPDQTFTVDRLGTMKVLRAIQEDGKIKTDLAMKYGRTRYEIEAAGIQHESAIRTPSGTLALRGTSVAMYDQVPYTPQATSLTGRAVYATAKRQISFGAKGQGKTRVDADQESAAETAAKIAQLERVINPQTALELTEAETRQLAVDVSGGAIRFDRLIVGGFNPPPRDLAAAGALPGKLNFVATWTGFVDLDLFVIVNPNTPQQRILGNPSVSRLFPEQVQHELPSGARIDFDKQSVQKGDFEVAYWPNTNYKGGIYGIGAIHQDFRTVDPAYDGLSTVKFEVYLDGKKLDTVLTNPDDVREGAAPTFGTTYTTRTDLEAGRDVVTTVAIVPDPNETAAPASKSVRRATAKGTKGAPAAPATPTRAAAALPAAKPAPSPAGARVVSGKTMAARPKARP